MAIRLTENRYGNSRVRLLRVDRQEGRHDIKELTLAIRFAGDFEAAHRKGDNRKILPADTMKNTVYALARQHPTENVEELCIQLIDHFLTYNPQVFKVRIDAAEDMWMRMALGGKPHPAAFVRAGSERRTAVLTATREKTEIRAGIDNLAVLKTRDSAFDNFLRDPYTTLKEGPNRILSTMIRADWLYPGEEAEFGPLWHGVRQILLETFADHNSLSLQHTVYAMGEAVLNNFDNIREIHLSLLDKHFQLIGLEALGMDNAGEVYLPMDEPHGSVEATLTKD